MQTSGDEVVGKEPEDAEFEGEAEDFGKIEWLQVGWGGGRREDILCAEDLALGEVVGRIVEQVGSGRVGGWRAMVEHGTVVVSWRICLLLLLERRIASVYPVP